ncbi:YvrJ family protein [Paraclostridium bifermentans]|nr:YvrJ family protein [Paraclostridium bifermentans]
MELDLMALVSNLGLPAIVTMYLLIRIEGKLENLSTSINSLSNNIYELNNKKYFSISNYNI